MERVGDNVAGSTLLEVPLGTLEGVLHELGDRHGSDSSGNGSDE